MSLPGWADAVLHRWRLCVDDKRQLRHLPNAGGVGDQPALLMDAFRLINVYQ